MTTKKKVLLMGKSGAGKTSMRSIIFANFIARDTRRLGATIEVEHSHVRFLGNLVLNLWDCGGQEAFLESYLSAQKENIFRSVEVLIYVFDVESREIDKDLADYKRCLEALSSYSPDAKVFCLIHKMDLIQTNEQKKLFEDRQSRLTGLTEEISKRSCTCFATSIWDETLYKAWSAIVYQLIPNIKQIETSLVKFAELLEADEILLFEKATFLVICHCERKNHPDIHRFEKISNIIKQFKISCSKVTASFNSIEVRNSKFAAYIESFTPNTYVMVVTSDPEITSIVTLSNIRNGQKHFEKLEKADVKLSSLGANARS